MPPITEGDYKVALYRLEHSQDVDSQALLAFIKERLLNLDEMNARWQADRALAGNLTSALQHTTEHLKYVVKYGSIYKVRDLAALAIAEAEGALNPSTEQ